MRNYNFKTKYFLTALLMGCKLVSASNMSDQNDTDQRHISSQQPYLLYQDTATTLNWGYSYNDEVITVNPSFPIPTQSTNTFLSEDTNIVSTTLTATSVGYPLYDDESLSSKRYTDTVSIIQTDTDCKYSSARTTQKDWGFDKYPKNNQEKADIREEIFRCHIDNPLRIIKITSVKFNQLNDIVCYFDPSFSAYLSHCKTQYPYSESVSDYILRFKHDNKDSKVNFAPFRKFHKDGVLPDSIIDQILNFSNFKVMDFRTDFEYLQVKIKHLSINSNDQDQKDEQLSQSSVAGEDVLNIITNHISRISNVKQRQTAYWHTIHYLRQHVEGSDEVILELCQQITDKTLPFYKDAVVTATEIDFGQNNNLINNIKQRYQKPIIGLLEISSADLPVPAFLTTLTQSFHNNGKLGSNPPPVLQDLKVTPENTFELIDFMREQKIVLDQRQLELQAAQLEIETLKAELAALKVQKTNDISN